MQTVTGALGVAVPAVAADDQPRRVVSRVKLVALVLVAVSVAYRMLWNLAGSNLGVDEPTYTQAGVAYLHGHFSRNRQHPPVAKYVYGLAQVVSGEGGVSARYVAALATMAGGVVLFLWIRQELGWWAGLLAGGLWGLTPKGGGGLHTDLGRYALLEPIMVFFAIAALAAGWQWSRTQRWWWLTVAGGMLALSVTSKVSTVFLLPVLLLLPALGRRWRLLPKTTALIMGSFVVVFVLVYLPVGIVSAVRFMIAFQHRVQVQGHAVPIAGELRAHPPWWANLWFLQQGVGLTATVLLAFGVVMAFALRPDKLVAYLGLGLGFMCVFYLGVAGTALATYYYAFMPFVTTLAAIGYIKLWNTRAALPRLLSGTVLVTLGAVAGLQLPSIASQHPTGMALIIPTLHGCGITEGTLLFRGVSPSSANTYLEETPIHPGPPPYVAVVVGPNPRFPPTPAVTRLLKDERSAFTFFDLNGIELWVAHTPIRLEGGMLTTRPTGDDDVSPAPDGLACD